jgi:hypothetical protein
MTLQVADPCAWMADQRDRARAWAAVQGSQHLTARTGAYIDLIFAYAMARLGEEDAVKELVRLARADLERTDEAHGFLRAAFEYRIRQALKGVPAHGPLPAELVAPLEGMDRLLCYVADRFRLHSHILEPDERVNPYRGWGARINELEQALATLTNLTDPSLLEEHVQALLAWQTRGPQAPQQRARILSATLNVSARLSLSVVQNLMDCLPETYDRLPTANNFADVMTRVHLLERGFQILGRSGLHQHADPLMARLLNLIRTEADRTVLTTLAAMVKGFVRSLAQAGFTQQVIALLGELAWQALRDRPLADIDFVKESFGAPLLMTLLHLAGAWFAAGQPDRARPLTEHGRSGLRAPWPARERTQVASAWAAMAAQAPAAQAQGYLTEVFDCVEGVRDTYTTASHFSMSQLDVVEAVVLAGVEALTRPESSHPVSSAP